MISVYGATGFIGSRFCEMYPDQTIKIPREQRTPESDIILYTISTTHNYNDLSVDVSTNLQVLSEVLEQLYNGQEFNFISSWFVYNPQGNYSYTKFLAERLVSYYCTAHDIPYRIFRIANVFGKGDKFSKQKNALQWLIDRMRYNIDIELYYDGEFLRNYVWVDDLCNLLYQGMDILPTSEFAYDLGSDKSVVFGDLVRLAHAALGSTSQIRDKENIPEFHKKIQTKDFIFPHTISTEQYLTLPRSGTIPEKLVRMIMDES